MEMREGEQLVIDPVLRKEHEDREELPLEVLDVPISQLLQMYKSRDVPRRWRVE